MYAIDSLRQLGIKYLEREELAKFTFQNDILKPFVILMRNNRSATIRTLIVDCIVQVSACTMFIDLRHVNDLFMYKLNFDASANVVADSLS